MADSSPIRSEEIGDDTLLHITFDSTVSADTSAREKTATKTTSKKRSSDTIKKSKRLRKASSPSSAVGDNIDNILLELDLETETASKSPPKKRKKKGKSKSKGKEKGKPRTRESVLVENVTKRKRQKSMVEFRKRRKVMKEGQAERNRRREEEEKGEPEKEVELEKVEYHPTVKRTVEEGTVFPMDFFSPGGLGSIELDHLNRTLYSNLLSLQRGQSRYAGHNNPLIHDVSSTVKVPKLTETELDAMRRRIGVLTTNKETYTLPTSRLAKKKYARFLIRDDTTMPTTFPFTFAPHSHQYIFTENGVENMITGTLADGHSCTLRLTGFRPYIYVQIPSDLTVPSKAPSLERIFSEFLGYLNTALAEKVKKDKGWLKWLLKDRMDQLILTTKPVFQKHINNRTYQGREPRLFMKIETVHPMLIRSLRFLLQRPFGGKVSSFAPDETPHEHNSWLPETRFRQFGFTNKLTVMEAHIDYNVRFLVDRGLQAAGVWFVFNKLPIMTVPKHIQLSHSNLEITTSFLNVRSASDKFVEKNPPIRIDGKFDIEVETFGPFPQPDTNRITQIVLRLRFGHLGQATPEDEETLIDTPMPSGEAIRKPGCTVAICLCLDPTKASKKYSVIPFTEEKDMLLAFHELMIVLQPDFLAGHYSDVFDWDYLFRRAAHLGITCFPYFARIHGEAAYNTAQKKNTTKKGVFRPVTHVAGMVVWDFFKYADDFMFAKTKSLNALSEEYLKKHKIEVQYSLIGTLMKTVKGRTLLAKYCNYDVVLLELLDNKVSALKFLHAMANLCNVPIQMLGDRASTFRMLGLWLFYTQRYHGIAYPAEGAVRQFEVNGGASETPRELGVYPGPNSLNSTNDPNFYHDKNLSSVLFLSPTPDLYEKRLAAALDPYEGGTVMEPVRGFHPHPSQTLDFRSLYPSIMIALNIDFMTLIQKGMQDMICDFFKLDRKRDVWDEPRFLLGYDQWTTRPYIDPKNKPSYVREHVVKGIICYVEEYVLANRAVAKGTMGEYYKLAKETDDPKMKASYLLLAGIYNLQQLVLKIICNGMYGALGMGGGAFSLREAAETITNLSRQALEYSRYSIMRQVRKNNGWDFNVVIIYGDSVTGDSALIVRRDGRPTTVRIDELVTEDAWKPYDEIKEAAETPGLEVWQDGGFTRVKRVIRHKCKKKMYRVLTHTGVVDVTEDHSLLRTNGTKVPPKDVSIGEDLLHASDAALLSTLSSMGSTAVSEDEAFAMGLFLADGSCGRYDTKREVKYSWVINKKDRSLLQEAAESLPFKTKILDTVKSSHVYKLVPVGGIKEPATRYRALFYNEHKEKRIPPEILCATLPVVKEFWRGFHAGDGDKVGKKKQENTRVDQKGKEVTTGLWLLARRLGMQVSINDREDKLNVFRLNMSEEDTKMRNDPRAIKKIRELPETEDYVYDLTTENHHFHVGPGDLVVHNTDSVFVIVMDLDKKDIAWAGEFGNAQEMKEWIFSQFDAVCKMMNKTFFTSMLLQNEKNAMVSLLNTPKCYALYMSEGKTKPYFRKASGLSCVRRGGCELQRNMCSAVVDAIVVDKDRQKAIKIVRDTVARVNERKLKQKEILMRSSLSKTPKEYTKGSKPPHVIMAEKNMARGGAPARAGDRVYYIVVGGPPKSLVSDRVEAPDVIIKKKIPYCINYYREVVMKEARKILRTVVDQTSFADKFKFSEWCRKTNGKPGGRDKVAKAKAKMKGEMDKLVGKVILDGLEITFDDKPPSLYDLPPEYQGELPEQEWHWAGYDPEQDVPHLSEYKPPWMQSEKDKAQLIHEYDNAVLTDHSDDGEDGLPSIPNLEVASAKTIRKSQIDPEEDDEVEEGEDDCGRGQKKGEKIVHYMEVFSKQKVTQPRYRSFKQTVKKGTIPSNSMFKKFLIPQDTCTVCTKAIPYDRSGVCDNCFSKPLNWAKRTEYRNEVIADIEELKTAAEKSYDICVKCVKDLDDFNEDMITDCFSFECSNWAPVRETKHEYQEKKKLMGPALSICFESDEEKETEKETEEEERQLDRLVDRADKENIQTSPSPSGNPFMTRGDLVEEPLQASSEVFIADDSKKESSSPLFSPNSSEPDGENDDFEPFAAEELEDVNPLNFGEFNPQGHQEVLRLGTPSPQQQSQSPLRASDSPPTRGVPQLFPVSQTTASYRNTLIQLSLADLSTDEEEEASIEGGDSDTDLA